MAPITADTQPTDSSSTAGRTWYEEFYSYIDARDASVVDKLCTPDTTMRFANHPEESGREAVRTGMAHFFTTIAGMRHTFTNVVENGDTAILEADVEYTRLDGSTVTIVCATAIERRDGLVASQRVYIDLAPLLLLP